MHRFLPASHPPLRFPAAADRAGASVRCLAAGFALAALAACGGEPEPGAVPAVAATPPAAAAPESSPAGTSPVGAPSAGAPAIGDDCPEWGTWTRCSVEDRLERAGVVLRLREQEVRHDFFTVPGLVYENSRVELQVFLFPDSSARTREMSAFDSVTVAPRGQRIVWRWPATLVTSNNMAAIILSLNDRSVERIALALGAGLPAAPPR